MNVIIRKEIRTDFTEVYELNKAAFGEETEAKLVDLLRNSSAFVPDLSLVATANNKVVGHILFTRIRIRNESGQGSESLALAPMAVKPEFQKQGIGGQLIRSGLDKAGQLGFKSVIVLGHEHYYPRFGFVPADRWGIKSPFDVPSGVFMALELEKDSLKDVQGTVEYSRAFYEV